MMPAAWSAAQKRARLRRYSAFSTGCPAARYGENAAHSWYWLHCSGQRAVEIRLQLRALFTVVLLQHRHPQRVHLMRDPPVEGELLSRGDGESAAVGERFDVVWLQRVEALVAAPFKAPLHDRLEHAQLADIDPALARPAVGAPEDRARERLVVRAEVLGGASIDVAEHRLAF